MSIFLEIIHMFDPLYRFFFCVKRIYSECKTYILTRWPRAFRLPAVAMHLFPVFYFLPAQAPCHAQCYALNHFTGGKKIIWPKCWNWNQNKNKNKKLPVNSRCGVDFEIEKDGLYVIPNYSTSNLCVRLQLNQWMYPECNFIIKTISSIQH